MGRWLPFFHVLRGLKPVTVDILCFCAHLCVVSSCSRGGWETRPKHSHTNLQYGVWQWHHVEVPWRWCDGGGHFGWQHRAERSKSNDVKHRCACVGTVQLLERTRDALVGLSSARSRGGWETQVSFFSPMTQALYTSRITANWNISYTWECEKNSYNTESFCGINISYFVILSLSVCYCEKSSNRDKACKYSHCGSC